MSAPKPVYSIVIDGVGTSTAQNVLSGLASHNSSFHTVGLDMAIYQPGKLYVREFVVSPPAKSEDYLPFLKKVFRKLGGKVLYIPIIDYGFLAASKEDFGQNVLALISDSRTISLCDDKLALAEFFDMDPGKPFSIPLDERSMTLDTASYPLISKPRKEGRASLGVSKMEDITEAKRVLKKLGNNSFYQEFISGKEVTVDVLCSLEGDFISYLCRERLEVKAGVCQKARCFKSLRYEHIVKHLATMLRFKGPFNAQFIHTEDDRIYLIEINPRFSGGLNLSIAAGWDPIRPLDLMVHSYFSKETEYKVSTLQLLADRNVQEGYAYKTSLAVFERKDKVLPYG